METPREALERILVSLEVFEHAVRCEKGSACMAECVAMQKLLCHYEYWCLSRVDLVECDVCVQIRQLVDRHSTQCRAPTTQCLVPGCHARVVDELVEMGMDRTFLETRFA